MTTRDARIVNDQVILQPASDADDCPDQGIEFESIDDQKSVRGKSIDLFIHNAIIMWFRLPQARMQSSCIVSCRPIGLLDDDSRELNGNFLRNPACRHPSYTRESSARLQGTARVICVVTLTRGNGSRCYQSCAGDRWYLAFVDRFKFEPFVVVPNVLSRLMYSGNTRTRHNLFCPAQLGETQFYFCTTLIVPEYLDAVHSQYYGIEQRECNRNSDANRS